MNEVSRVNACRELARISAITGSLVFHTAYPASLSAVTGGDTLRKNFVFNHRVISAHPLLMRTLPWLLCVALFAGIAILGLLYWGKGGVNASPTPLNDTVDAFVCPSGLTRVVMVRGVEDGFVRGQPEAAQISPRLLRNGYYSDLAEGGRAAAQLRNYDEGGADRVLIDHFDVPGMVVSGALVMRVADAARGSSNDGVLIGDLDTLATPDLLNSGRTFTTTFAGGEQSTTRLVDGSRLVKFAFNSLKLSGINEKASPDFLSYLGRKGHTSDVDLSVGEDTKIDALALLICQRPDQARGVTFAEHRLKPMGANVSWMGCMIDQAQSSCEPLVGDRLCSVTGPVACYHDGARTVPPELTAIGLAKTAFVGGEIRLSAPVRGDRFSRLADANRFCAASFGAGWRVLSYHEGGGGQVVSYSAIAPRTRALVNIRDQQFGNCWDRDFRR